MAEHRGPERHCNLGLWSSRWGWWVTCCHLGKSCSSWSSSSVASLPQWPSPFWTCFLLWKKMGDMVPSPAAVQNCQARRRRCVMTGTWRGVINSTGRVWQPRVWESISTSAKLERGPCLLMGLFWGPTQTGEVEHPAEACLLGGAWYLLLCNKRRLPWSAPDLPWQQSTIQEETGRAGVMGTVWLQSANLTSKLTTFYLLGLSTILASTSGKTSVRHILDIQQNSISLLPFPSRSLPLRLKWWHVFQINVRRRRRRRKRRRTRGGGKNCSF